MVFKRGIKFLLHKRKASETKNLAIRMRVTIQGETPVDFPTGCCVDSDFWDSSNFIVIDGFVGEKGNTTDSINETISHFKQAALDAFARFDIIEKKKPTNEEIKTLINDITGRKPVFEEKPIKVKKAFEEYIETIGVQNNWSESSYKKNNTIKKHFLASAGNIYFNQITTDTLQSFIHLLLVKRGMRNTTIQKDYQFVRWFLGWARRKGYYNGNEDETFRPRLKGTDGNQKTIIYLTIEELGKLQNVEIPIGKNYLSQVRDVFLFCCFTSLRYSDVKALRKADIINGNAIRVITQKTTDGLIIELNEKAQSILAKYKDYQSQGGFALPVISNQRYNEYLKELGELAELNEETRIVYYKGSQRYDEFYPKYQLLTSHVARRTFVVTALLLGIPVEVIIRWTGHSDYDALKPYVAIVDQLKKAEMKKFDKI
ncbi:MAG: phage integrase SAM-like domain-containing protein [Alphaproteobacteria bacterium]|nr:phage integrase SAM-like domain-containing protein [Alphaproteobacteria bacterium]